MTSCRFTLLAAALACLVPGLAAAASGHAAAVDPRIGTGGDGHTFPGATAPFGRRKISETHMMPDESTTAPTPTWV